MKKVLLFPGAFNPPHIGHEEIVKIATDTFSFNEIWIMPSGNRLDKQIDTSFAHRRELGKLFVSYLSNKINIPVKLITDELDDKQNRYTHQILKEIKSNPTINIKQLIGLDGITSLFLNDSRVLDDGKFLVIDRPGFDFPKDFPIKKINLIKGATIEISSTQIRNWLSKKNEEYRKYLPPMICEYIEKNNLYQKNN